MGHDVGVGPRIQVRDAKGNRQEQQSHERQRARGRFQDPPQDQAPDSAGQIVQHRERERAECDAEPVEIRPEIGAHRGGTIDQPADGDERQAGAAE